MIDASHIINRTLDTGNVASLREAAMARPSESVESGKSMGLNLEVMSDPMEELMDSMEELTFSFEEKAMKKLGDRKLGKDRGVSQSFMKSLDAWMKLFPGMPGSNVLRRIFEQVRNAQRQGNDAQGLLNDLLDRESSDPSVKFAMLKAMAELVGKDESKLAQVFNRALAELETEHGAEVRAGINIAGEVNARARDAAEMQELRDLYRGETIGFSTPQNCFRSLLSAYGPGNLKNALDFLVKGCGVDLNSPSPSQSPEELRRILLDLQAANVLAEMLDRAARLRGRMESGFGESCALSAEEIAGKLADMTEASFVAATSISGFIDECKVRQLLAKVCFTTELFEMVRTLSPRLFQDEESRQRILSAVQEHLDGLIDEQERKEAAA